MDPTRRPSHALAIPGRTSAAVGRAIDSDGMSERNPLKFTGLDFTTAIVLRPLRPYRSGGWLSTAPAGQSMVPGPLMYGADENSGIIKFRTVCPDPDYSTGCD